jgi:hypothetical protein
MTSKKIISVVKRNSIYLTRLIDVDPSAENELAWTQLADPAGKSNVRR